MYDPNSVHVITWYRCGQSTFSSCDHINRQRKAKMDNSTIGQKPQRMKSNRTKPPKEKIFVILQHSRCMIPFLFMWSHDVGVDNYHSLSCDHFSQIEKSQNGQKHYRTKAPKIKLKADKTPKERKYSNTPRIMVYNTISFMWSHDTGVDNQHSCHAITWAET